jgi:hypothetical protein
MAAKCLSPVDEGNPNLDHAVNHKGGYPTAQSSATQLQLIQYILRI